LTGNKPGAEILTFKKAAQQQPAGEVVWEKGASVEELGKRIPAVWVLLLAAFSLLVLGC